MSREQLEAFGQAIELQSVVLPDAQHARFFGVILPETGSRIVDAAKDRILWRRDPHEPV